jgi:hypothetical protein
MTLRRGPCLAQTAAAIVMFVAVTGTRAVLAPFVVLRVRAGAEIVVGASIYLIATWTHAPGTLLRLRELATAANASRSIAKARV